MGAKSQKKGRGGELELARILSGYGYQIEPRKALNFGTEPDLTGLPGIHIESKRAEKLHLSEWMEQATKDSQKFKDGIPAVFHRKNREGWLVTVRLEDFMSIYEGGKEHGKTVL